LSSKNNTQTEKAVFGLRGMIVHGDLGPGERVLEQALVEKLEISRTPARAAILRICEEGLITQLPNGGFVVSSFTEKDASDAIAIRGTLEGAAARFAAEKGVPSRTLQKMRDCLEEIDVALRISDIGIMQDDYATLNDTLHGLVLEAAQSNMLVRALQRLTAIPFALNNSFTDIPQSAEEEVMRILNRAQDQHRRIIDAIEHREGTRAESLTIEHSRSTWEYITLMLHVTEDASLPRGFHSILGTRRV